MSGTVGDPALRQITAVVGQLVRYDGRRVIRCGTCTVAVATQTGTDGVVLLPYGIDPLTAGRCVHGVLLDIEGARKIAAALGGGA